MGDMGDMGTLQVLMGTFLLPDSPTSSCGGRNS